MTKRVLTVALAFALLVLSQCATSSERKAAMIDNFEANSGWQSVNDNVMGGRSAGRFEIQKGVLVFEGAINTNGGGFASIRRPLVGSVLAGASGIRMRLKSDGRVYKLTLRGDTRFRGRPVNYQAVLPAATPGQWSVIDLDFSDLRPSVFGQRVSVPPLDLSTVWSFGLIIADGVDGPFQLEVESIETISSK